MSMLVGARPFRDFEPALLSHVHAPHLAGGVRQLLDGPVSADSRAVAAGVGLALASARTGRTDLPRLASTVGCMAEDLTVGLTSLVDHSLARKDTDGVVTLLSEVEPSAPDEPARRYVSAGVQVLAANASVNRWGDTQLIQVGTALVALSAPSVVRQRRPVPTWRVAGVCGLSLPLTRVLLRELTLRHAAVGSERHLPTVPDRLQ